MDHVDDCKRFIECLSAHFDGELDGELLIEFEHHLQTCSRAQVLVRTFERTIVLHRSARQQAVPADIHRRLLEAVKRCCEEGDD
ncbi:MAG: zf-HC2 domain-containing protein [Candidatus Eisenbacteria bacterium]|nr:zf-HC2 domain-containing protein [Candidatus Eisenbacteria bacterium]